MDDLGKNPILASVSKPDNTSNRNLDETELNNETANKGSSTASAICRQQPKSADLQISCAICDDKASGLHYGVHACEGCKGFFRRTTRLKLTYKKCIARCKISVKNRNKCQYCRFQKCIKLGMSHEAIRFGRMARTTKEKIMFQFVKSSQNAEAKASVSVEQDKINRLAEEVSSAFDRHISITRTKMVDLWNTRSIPGTFAPTLSCVKDAKKLYSNFYGLFSQPNIKPQSNETLAQRLVDEANFLTDDSSASSPFLIEGSNAPNVSCSHIKYFQDSEAEEKSSPDSAKVKCNPMCIRPSGDVGQVIRCAAPSIFRKMSELGLTNEEIAHHARLNRCSVIQSAVRVIRDKKVKIILERSIRGDSKYEQEYKDSSQVDAKGKSSSAQKFDSCKGSSSEPSSEPGPDVGVRLVKFLYQRMQTRIVKGIRELIRFAKSLQNFTHLSLSDQLILVKYGSYEALFILLSTMIFEEGILFPQGNLYTTFNFVAELGPAASIMQPKIDFARKIAAFNLSDEELALLIAIVLLSTDRPHLAMTSTIESMQSDLVAALQFRLQTRRPAERQLFAKLLNTIADLRQLVAEHVMMTQRVGDWISDVFHPVLSEILSDRTFC